jgi:PAS domain S-box-containing protein
MDRFTGKPMPNAPSEIERARFVAAVADHLPGMVAYWDADLLCRFANKAYLEWFGWTPADLIGTHIRQLLGEDLFARNAPYIDGALGGQRQSFERTLEKPSGDIGHTWAQYIPDIAPDGAVRGFYVLVTDITDLRQTTKALELANAE